MLDFAIAIAVATGGAAAVVAVLARPFHRVVIDLCGTVERARFWTAYVSLLFVLGPVLAVSFAALFASEGLNLKAAVFWSAGALFLGLVIFGRNVWRPTARLFEEERRAAMPAPKG